MWLQLLAVALGSILQLCSLISWAYISHTFCWREDSKTIKSCISIKNWVYSVYVESRNEEDVCLQLTSLIIDSKIFFFFKWLLWYLFDCVCLGVGVVSSSSWARLRVRMFVCMCLNGRSAGDTSSYDPMTMWEKAQQTDLQYSARPFRPSEPIRVLVWRAGCSNSHSSFGTEWTVCAAMNYG